jgi:peptide/nickel transport system substrate-binding protein
MSGIRNPRHRTGFGSLLVVALCALFVGACAPQPQAPSQPGEAAPRPPARTKTLTLGTTTTVKALGMISEGTPTGGWGSIEEVYSDALVTTGQDFRLVGRLAERVPSVEDGTVSVLPDGQMRVVFNLRRGVTWHDGTPFTAQDLAFSYRPLNEYGASGNDAAKTMTSVVATDDYTAVFTYQAPHYLGNTLVMRRFQPLPRHILEPAYREAQASGVPDAFINHPYWTTDFVHLGPFRLTSFDPGTSMRFEAYDGYFQGRPKIDAVIVRSFASPQALFAELLAGSVQMFMDGALSEELAQQLIERWRDGSGEVYIRPGGLRTIFPQHRPEYQAEAANLDPRVRGALYRSLDRDGLASARSGTSIGAWSIVSAQHLHYEAVKDALRAYAYDPQRARAELGALGWTPGPDGTLRNAADGRPFHTHLSVTTGDNFWELSVYADYWRRIGLEVEELPIPGPLQRDGQHRATYPGYEASSGAQGDNILSRLTGPPAAPENRWGGNRCACATPESEALLDRYFTSLAFDQQASAYRAISDYVVRTLNIMPVYFSTDFLGRAKGVVAFGDVEGSLSSPSQSGTFSRHSYVWDLE